MAVAKDDPIIASLKKRWFDLALKEKLGKTPEITAELDNIQEGIRRLQSQGAHLATLPA